MHDGQERSSPHSWASCALSCGCPACLSCLYVVAATVAITCDVNGTRETAPPAQRHADCTLTFEDPYARRLCLPPMCAVPALRNNQQLSFIPPDGKFKLLSFVGRRNCSAGVRRPFLCMRSVPSVRSACSRSDILTLLQRLWAQLTHLCQAIGLLQRRPATLTSWWSVWSLLLVAVW